MRLQPVRRAGARCACLLVALASTTCAHRGADTRPSEAELRAFFYTDDEGLQVVTTGAQLTQRLPWGDTLTLEAGLDAIELEPVDVVSGASVIADGDSGLTEQRYEVAPGYSVALGSAEAPIDLGVRGRVSSEPDYTSWSGEVGATLELFERNTTLGGFVGYGHDTIDPTSFAEGDEDRWPASHERVYGGVGLRQLLTRHLDIAAGLSVTWQSGALASPYRRALVLIGQGFFARLDPRGERHPGERTRAVGFLSTSAYLGRGMALHLRVAGYADSWDVLALQPELALDIELGSRVLLILGYRLALQGAADFHARRYTLTDDIRTGDRRLGALDEHLAGFELRWTVAGAPNARGSLDLAAGWALSLLTYRGVDPAREVLAHEAALGLLLRY